jgi:hypothetical protein
LPPWPHWTEETPEEEDVFRTIAHGRRADLARLAHAVLRVTTRHARATKTGWGGQSSESVEIVARKFVARPGS